MNSSLASPPLRFIRLTKDRFLPSPHCCLAVRGSGGGGGGDGDGGGGGKKRRKGSSSSSSGGSSRFTATVFWFSVFFLLVPSNLPRSGELRTQKLKSHLVRTQSLNVLPLKRGVGQYTAIHTPLTARNFFPIPTLAVHSSAFFLTKTSPDFFSCVGCG